MSEKKEYMDLLFFGYDWGEDAEENRNLESNFIKDLSKQFNSVEFRNAYDNIKGFRQEVFMPKKEEKNYYSWLIGNGYFELSMSMQLMFMSAKKEPEINKKLDTYISLAKKQYPKAFKPEALSE